MIGQTTCIPDLSLFLIMARNLDIQYQENFKPFKTENGLVLDPHCTADGYTAIYSNYLKTGKVWYVFEGPKILGCQMVVWKPKQKMAEYGIKCLVFEWLA